MPTTTRSGRVLNNDTVRSTKSKTSASQVAIPTPRKKAAAAVANSGISGGAIGKVGGKKSASNGVTGNGAAKKDELKGSGGSAGIAGVATTGVTGNAGSSGSGRVVTTGGAGSVDLTGSGGVATTGVSSSGGLTGSAGVATTVGSGSGGSGGSARVATTGGGRTVVSTVSIVIGGNASNGVNVNGTSAGLGGTGLTSVSVNTGVAGLGTNASNGLNVNGTSAGLGATGMTSGVLTGTGASASAGTVASGSVGMVGAGASAGAITSGTVGIGGVGASAGMITSGSVGIGGVGASAGTSSGTTASGMGVSTVATGNSTSSGVKRKIVPVTIMEGYAMRLKNTSKSGQELYYCVKRLRASKCRAAVTIHNGVTTYLEEHCHSEDEEAAQSEAVKDYIRANATTDTPKKIIDDARAKYGVEAASIAGGYKSLRQMISRTVGKGDADTDAANATFPSFQGAMTKCIDDERFLFKDGSHQGNRHTIFMSDVQAKMLAKCSTIIIDSTFSVVKPPYTQLFTVMDDISSGVMRTCAFVLMESRTTDDYREVIQSILLHPFLHSWNPTHVLLDMESAQRAAITTVFPNIIHQLCLFHVLQAWKRRLMTLGMKNNIERGGDLNGFWKLLKALPYMPEQDVLSTFDTLYRSAPTSAALSNFYNYLVANYLSPTNVSSWNCHQRGVLSGARTSNSLESTHRNLTATKKDNRQQHLMSDLLKKMRIEEQHARLDFEELSINPGANVNARRRIVDIRKDQRLSRALVNQPALPQIPLNGIEWLKAISIASRR